jgi:hypothetical protein
MYIHDVNTKAEEKNYLVKLKKEKKLIKILPDLKIY